MKSWPETVKECAKEYRKNKKTPEVSKEDAKANRAARIKRLKAKRVNGDAVETKESTKRVYQDITETRFNTIDSKFTHEEAVEALTSGNTLRSRSHARNLKALGFMKPKPRKKSSGGRKLKRDIQRMEEEQAENEAYVRSGKPLTLNTVFPSGPVSFPYGQLVPS